MKQTNLSAARSGRGYQFVASGFRSTSKGFIATFISMKPVAETPEILT